MNIRIVSTIEEKEMAFSVRKLVFIHEQQVPPEEEIDDLEESSVHFLVTDENEIPIGAGRFRELDGYGKVERICVLGDRRTKGIGKQLMHAIEQYALSCQVDILKLNAQTHAIPFYEKLGYRIVSEEFLDAGIPHKTMKKRL